MRRAAVVAPFVIFAFTLGSSPLAAGQTLQPAGEQPVKVQIVEPENPDFHNRISFGPIGLLVGVANFAWEIEVVPRFAFELSPWGIYFGFGGEKVYGGSFGIGGVVYLTGNAPEGLRLSLSVAPGGLGASGQDWVFMLGVRAMFGYNWVWRSGFTLGLSGGAQYIYATAEGLDTPLTGILPAVDFNLGFCF